MAFPTIPTVAANTLLSSTTSPASTTHTFPSLTTLAPAQGDLIIAICVQYGAATAGNQFSAWGASLLEILDDSQNATGTGALGVAYKVAAGTETGTFTVTSVNSFKSVNFLMRIPKATWAGSTIPEVLAAVRAAGLAADPGSFDPANWAAEDTLWIAVAGQTETSTTGSPPTLDTPPTNYSGQLIVARAADAVGDITAGVAFRQVNASAEDVGTWTGTNLNRGNGIATVIAVRPAFVEATTIAGAVAGGPAQSPGTFAVPQGGAVGQGVAFAPVVPLTIQGAVAGGFTPTEDIASGGVTETPTPGGAVASGNAPVAVVSETSQGAVAGGPAPTAQTTLTAQGSAASGPSPSAIASLSAQGALAGGVTPSFAGTIETPTPGAAAASGASPTSSVASTAGGAVAGGQDSTAEATLGQGGAAADGTTPTTAASLSAGGATAGGNAPTEYIYTYDTLTIAGATAGGSAPLGALMSFTISGAVAGGFAPGEQITGGDLVPIGGASAGGFSPTAAVTSTTGGALATGLDASASVSLVIGGALGGGIAPHEPGGETATIGGAVAGGFAPGPGAPVDPGGGVSSGTTGGALVTLLIGGALARGNAPTEIGVTPPGPGTVIGGTRQPALAFGGTRGSRAAGGTRVRDYAVGGDRRSDE